MIIQSDFISLSNELQIKWLDGLLDKERSCGNKIKYSELSAIKAAKAMERKLFPKEFDVYCCLWCHSWHIGGSVINE